MNSSQQRLKQLLILGLFLTGYLFISSCNPNNGGNFVKQKKWIEWQIEFDQKITQENKTKTLLAIEKYIIDDMMKQDYPESIQLNRLTFSCDFSNVQLPVLTVSLNRSNLISRHGVRVPPIPPTPPIKILFPADFDKNSGIKTVVDRNRNITIYNSGNTNFR